ncbi:hypothetical protein EYM_03010 [Ignicoccus islandicus DSM 13165]|uniref:Uncharacterized protein n=1 Tax=Ignicoccus islandicus DSM 13165 TaxID=940295 RepID=A0A0U3FNQ1_9CREN|nr:hypothetical protein [Ignicoccus islandicus]ALU11607.1 hypothetical protein EYM_03010 [Ignicoccus islandicus DSM 13165]
MSESSQLPQSISTVLNYIAQFYTWLQTQVAHYLQIYVFEKNPVLAERYGNLIVLMTTLTIIYALLEFFESFKKVLKYIIGLGWFILVLSIAFNFLNK